MTQNSREKFRRTLDRLEIPVPSANFENKLHQDWQAFMAQRDKPSHAWSDVLALVGTHRKLTLLLTSIALIASVLLAQKLYLDQEEDLNNVDVMSELSLSTI